MEDPQEVDQNTLKAANAARNAVAKREPVPAQGLVSGATVDAFQRLLWPTAVQVHSSPGLTIVSRSLQKLAVSQEELVDL